MLGGTSLVTQSFRVSITGSGAPGVVPVGTGLYPKNSSVTVSVPHVSGYVFNYWGGSCNLQSVQQRNYSTQSYYSYTIANLQSDCDLIAYYVKDSDFWTVVYQPVELSTTGNGTVSIGSLTSSSSTGSSVFQGVRTGDAVVVSAHANAGYTFTGWSGDLIGYGSSSTVFVNKPISASASLS